MPDVKSNGCVHIKFYIHEVPEKIWLCKEINGVPQVSEKKTKHLELSVKKTEHLKTTWTGYNSRFQFQPVYEQAKKDLKTDEWETELAGIEKIVTIARKAPEVKSKRPMSRVPNMYCQNPVV